MEMEIENLLERLLDVNEAMSRCAPAATPAAAVAQKLTRHRDILHEFTQVASSFSYLGLDLKYLFLLIVGL